MEYKNILILGLLKNCNIEVILRKYFASYNSRNTSPNYANTFLCHHKQEKDKRQTTNNLQLWSLVHVPRKFSFPKYLRGSEERISKIYPKITFIDASARVF